MRSRSLSISAFDSLGTTTRQRFLAAARNLPSYPFTGKIFRPLNWPVTAHVGSSFLSRSIRLIRVRGAKSSSPTAKAAPIELPPTLSRISSPSNSAHTTQAPVPARPLILQASSRALLKF